MPPRLGVLLAVVFWGISFVATKVALREVSPVTLVFTRFVLGALLLEAVLAVHGSPLVPPRDAWGPLAGMAFIGVFVHQMLQSTALRDTSAVNTGWLIGLTPIWSAILATLFLRERFGPGKALGLAIGFAGALLVVTRGRLSQDVLGLPSTRGDLLVLASTVNWAFYSVLGLGTLRRLGPACATAGIALFGAAMLAVPFVLTAGWRELPALGAAGWGAILFLGLGCSGLGYLFWYGALERIEATRVAAYLYLEPLVTMLAAAWLLRERITTTTVAGGLLVLAGVLVVQRAGRAAAAPVEEAA